MGYYIKFGVKMNKVIPKSAFTLAEVLITLGITGAVAAMTLPSLISKYEKLITVVRLKKIYSLMQESINLAKAKYGEETFIPDCGSRDYCPYNSELFLEALQSKNCGKELNNYVNKIRNSLNGYTQYASLSQCQQLKDGTIIFPSYTFGTITVYGYTVYLIDINGAKNPNRFGRDLFTFIHVPQVPMYYSKINLGIGSIAVPNNGKPGLYPAGYIEDVGWSTCSRTKATGNCTYKIIKDGWKIKDDYPW